VRIALFQSNPVFGDVKANLDRVEEVIGRLKADMLVLPELFSTGYLFASEEEVRRLAEPIPDGESVRRLAGLVRKTGVAIAGGILERDGEAIYNSAVLIMPEGDANEAAGAGAGSPGGLRMQDGAAIGLYRKVHLFDEEKRWMRPGDVGYPVFDFRGVRFGIIICFDWTFPEATRCLAVQGMDVLLHPSNLVLPYCQDAMRTRALENGIFAVTANRVGEESLEDGRRLTFTGTSQIVGPRGEVLARAGHDEEELRVGEIEPELARRKELTERNHMFRDRRPETYEILTRPLDR